MISYLPTFIISVALGEIYLEVSWNVNTERIDLCVQCPSHPIASHRSQGTLKKLKCVWIKHRSPIAIPVFVFACWSWLGEIFIRPHSVLLSLHLTNPLNQDSGTFLAQSRVVSNRGFAALRSYGSYSPVLLLRLSARHPRGVGECSCFPPTSRTACPLPGSSS